MKIFILLLFFSYSAMSGIYECSSPNGRPEKTETKSLLTEVVKSSPNWFSGQNWNERGLSLKPFLFYYAIDTSEPFMRLTVDFEVSMLGNTCSSKGVDYVVLLNSEYVKNNRFLLCKNGSLSWVKLDEFKADKHLKFKHDFLRTGNHRTNDKGPMRYLVKYEDISRETFYEFPLAHPDFLYDMISLVTGEQSLFHANQYIPFINLKSHGSKDIVLTGLHKCQIESKTKAQKHLINRLLDKTEVEYLKNLSTNTKTEHLTKINLILGKLNLGAGNKLGITTLPLGALNSQDGLGSQEGLNSQDGLSIQGNNNTLSISHGTLGWGEGLGSETMFGTYHIALSSVLNDTFKEQSLLGFLMLESCDSNRNISFDHANTKNIFGVYSSKNLLWYRNLNWWEILKFSGGDTARLIQTLDTQTKNIKNFISKKIKI